MSERVSAGPACPEVPGTTLNPVRLTHDLEAERASRRCRLIAEVESGTLNLPMLISVEGLQYPFQGSLCHLAWQGFVTLASDRW
jgi:hypothetical protein